MLLRPLIPEDYPARILEDHGMIFHKETSKQKRRIVTFECIQCKAPITTEANVFKTTSTGKCKSCSSKKHGAYGRELYNVWSDIKGRCYNKTHKAYLLYGGKGVVLSEEFMDYYVFEAYLQSLPHYSKRSIGYSIDRIDSNGNYERGNLRWATKSTQAQNTIILAKNNTSGYRGVSLIKSTGKYECRIMVDNKSKYLGCYTSPSEAAYVYDQYILNHNLGNTPNGITLDQITSY